MIGSYEWLDYIPTVEPFSITKVAELDRLSSVELFMETAGVATIQELEVYELVKRYKDSKDMFDFTEIIPNLQEEEKSKMFSLQSLKDNP